MLSALHPYSSRVAKANLQQVHSRFPVLLTLSDNTGLHTLKPSRTRDEDPDETWLLLWGGDEERGAKEGTREIRQLLRWMGMQAALSV